MANNINCFALLKQFFTLYECPIRKETPHKLTVQLSKEMDKKLMNRPFYWKYMDSINQTGRASEVTFITDLTIPKEQNEIYFYVGSEKYFQILTILQAEKYTQLFEQVETTKQTMLIPWLLTNIRITYIGKQLREEIISFGINLVNGTICLEMMERLDHLILAPQISDYCYTISPLFSMQHAFQKMDAYCNAYLSDQTYEWAIDAFQEIATEKDLIDRFYLSQDKQKQVDKESLYEETEARLKPQIKIDVISGGMIYLKQGFIK